MSMIQKGLVIRIKGRLRYFAYICVVRGVTEWVLLAGILSSFWDSFWDSVVQAEILLRQAQDAEKQISQYVVETFSYMNRYIN